MTWGSADPLNDLVSFSRQLRNANRVGTPDHPYVVVVPKWFEERCIQQGTTAQEAYDQTFRNSSFRHGRVDIMESDPTRLVWE